MGRRYGLDHIHYNPDFIHHQSSKIVSLIREVVFGMEDGMVSTLGAVTGIAAATGDHFTVVLSGLIVVAVESVSMGVGSYLSNKSEFDIDERKLMEEKTELKQFPHEEKKELTEIYKKDGWPEELAVEMAEVASMDKNLFLKEMAFHELSIFPKEPDYPFKNGLAMFFSYVLGGAIPLLPYLLFRIQYAIPISILVTLVGLFLLGVGTTKFSKRKWWKAGLEMFGLASAAALIGYLVGQIVDVLFG